MKKILMLIFFVSLLYSCKLLKGKKASSSNKFEISIIQNGETVQANNNVIELDKSEFKLQIRLNNLEGVFVSYSFSPEQYYNLESNETIPDYKWLNLKARAEETFNSKQEMMIDTEAVSYLYYIPSEEIHRFDKELIIDGTTITGTKTINKYWNQDTDEKANIEDINQPVYLFFVATDAWERGAENPPKELQRGKLKLVWK